MQPQSSIECARIDPPRGASLMGAAHADHGAPDRRADPGTRMAFARPASSSAALSGRSVVSGRQLRLLLIDDDRLLSETLEQLLEEADFAVYATGRGDDAIELARTYRFDLAILDLSLPDVSGHQVLQAFRQDRPDMPVIILSGSGSLDSKLTGFQDGADDYVTKPFQVDELIARIHAVLRRANAAQPSALHVGALTIDLATRRALVGETLVPLTGKEFACLEFLASRRGTTVTKEMFLAHLYGGRDEPEMKIIDVFICKLRRKLADAGAAGLIETVWGRGYTILAA